ncbi:MAG: hypothetical protein JWO58_801 [Chitinophagaceae bacterium]|nr:hypothetical protein [Chitinophagaceae bacterium]
MGPAQIIRYIAHVFILLFMQLFLFRDTALLGYAYIFVHIGAILLLPTDTTPILSMIIAFCLGFLIDMFYDTIGLHAAACVLIAFIRPRVVGLFSVQGELNSMPEYNVESGGALWFFQFALVSSFVYCSLLFILESTSITIFFYSLLKIIASSLVTALFLTMYSYLWASRSKRR